MEKYDSSYDTIPREKFEFYKKEEKREERVSERKNAGWLQDACIRFCRSKISVAAGFMIFLLLLFAVLIPVVCKNSYTENPSDILYLQYGKLLPKWELFSWAGWDGCSKETLREADYYAELAIAVETGRNPVREVYRADYRKGMETAGYYDVKTDSYVNNGMFYLNVTKEEYEEIQNWQNETGIQVIYPAVDTSGFAMEALKNNANIWYACSLKGTPVLDAEGNFVPLYQKQGNDGGYDSLRISGDDGSYLYAQITGSSNALSYKVRVFSYTYFQYRYGFEPCFVFGTDAFGQDILTRLAKAARFSLLLAISVSVINLFLGGIYGAVAGFYGGAVDLLLERIADIVSGVPFIVVTSLFQLHLAQKVGAAPSFLFAFVLTGWIGIARTTRMQFYRYKKKEYVLAAKALGAENCRLMFRHILPNAVGTLVTGAVLLIPNVIYSESSLTYLGIVNLDSAELSSIGSMLSAGQSSLTTSPHVILFPAVYISLLMISFHLLGNGLRDAFNPSLRGADGES